jgi:sugar O-acyltransferase (sialic acid O-acetyltransferase NeuD family)
MKKKLIVVGTTTNARLAKLFFEKDTDYEVAAFAVNKEYITDDTFENLPVIPVEDMNNDYPTNEYDAFVAIGYTKMNEIRENLYRYVKGLGYKLPNYISPHCTFLANVENIGDNNLILEDNTIQPFVKIGSNNVLWSGNHIGHDSVIKDHCFITSHVVVSGYVTIESNCFLGVNSTLRDGISIGYKTLIGAGASVTKKTNEADVILPARSTLFSKKSYELEI